MDATYYMNKFQTAAAGHVSVDFGLLPLMEGWAPFNDTDLEEKIRQLAYQFLELAPIIDDLFEKRKKSSDQWK
jgi:hypothetical protein